MRDSERPVLNDIYWQLVATKGGLYTRGNESKEAAKARVDAVREGRAVQVSNRVYTLRNPQLR